MFHRYSTSIALMLGLIAGVAGADDVDAPLLNPPQAPKGFVLVEEDTWAALSDEPGRHMDRAREYFIAVDAKTAAAEIRKAAAHLRISAQQAAAESKQALLRSAHEMESLARRVEEGTVRGAAELEGTFARALHALSNYHYQMASESWHARQNRRTGQHLRAAADNLERATARAGQKLQHATHEVVKDSRIISGKLVEGTGFVFDEVGKGIATFGRQVDHVGKGIEPAPAPQASRLRNEAR